MRMFSCEEYSQKFYSWAKSTRESYVGRINDFIGANHQDVADTIVAIFNVAVASRLANR